MTGEFKSDLTGLLFSDQIITDLWMRMVRISFVDLLDKLVFVVMGIEINMQTPSCC